MIQLRDICLSYKDQVLFDHISVVFRENQHIGVVGRNGAGKSTLLKAIAGMIPLESGTISITRDFKIAYMPQEIVLTSNKSVFEETFSAFDELNALKREANELEGKLSRDADEAIIDRYTTLMEQLMGFDEHACIAQTEQVLKGLGFSREALQQPVTSLSVGWRMRIVLAKLLLQNADFYLFDEPTNHLDIVSKEWFFDFLRNAPFGFLLVSHDRYYLEKAVNHIFEIERGNGTMYSGGFSAYLVQKDERLAVQQTTYDRQQRIIEQKMEVVERFRASASRAKMAQNMLRQIERIERVEPPPGLPTMVVPLPPAPRSGSRVLTFKNLSMHFGDKTIFKGISGHLDRGEKVGLVAANGVGKTTLFNVMTGKYPSKPGAVEFGHSVSYAVFEQDQLDAMNPKNSVYEEVLSSVPEAREDRVRAMLGAFLFSGDDVDKKIAVLSGGERSRVALTKLFLQRANLLFLDEPTNHLDIYAKEVLLSALQKYDGTIFIVCHDHDFLERLVNRVVELTPTDLHSYAGTYESYLAQKEYADSLTRVSKQESKQDKSIKQSRSDASPEISGKDRHAIKRELSSLEGKIQRLEAKIAQLTEKFATLVYGTEAYQGAEQELAAAQKNHTNLLSEWERLAREIEG